MELNSVIDMNKEYKNTLIWFNIITIFPEMFHAMTNYGLIGQAIKKKNY